MIRRSLGCVVAVALVVACVAVAVPAGAKPSSPVAVPTVAPLTGGSGSPSFVGSSFDPGSVGYRADEYSLEGTAMSFTPERKLGPDGRWAVEEAKRAPYKTRILVFRPINAKDFDGTVFVEWLNVSAGFESAPDWGSAHTQMVNAGAAYVAVSAQAVGVQGGAATVAGAAGGGLKGADPERYGSLTHPGDAYSYDIFSQAGLAAAGKAKANPLGDLHPKRVIAMGESQSAFRMVTYVNAIQPIAKVFDGFLVHSRSASGAGFGDSSRSGIGDPEVPKTTVIRTDSSVPVLTFQTETDLTVLGFLPARQKDSARFRLWEVAGTSHADAYTGGIGFDDVGQGDAEKKLLDPAQASGGPLSCSEPINTGPAFAVLSAAVYHLERWVRDGTPPPRAPRLEVTAGPPVNIARDDQGNAKGGIRTPVVDVPVATLTGNKNAGGSFCGLFGTTAPLDAATIASLYPSHADYVKKFDAATDKAVKAGFMLPEQAKNYKAAAAAIAVGG